MGCQIYIHKNKNNRSYLEIIVIPNSLKSIAIKLVHNSFNFTFFIHKTLKKAVSLFYG